MLYVRFAVARNVELGNPRACCLVSLLDSRPLRPRGLHLTSAGSPTRYRILTPDSGHDLGLRLKRLG